MIISEIHKATASLAPPSYVGASAQRPRFYWFDWIRFIAALLVVFTHARGGNWVEWDRLAHDSKSVYTAAFFAFTRAGTEWVIVFFVLSGFLVGGKLLDRWQNNTFNLPAFIIDRLCRIWLPLVPALLLTALVSYLVDMPRAWLAFFGTFAGLQGVFVAHFGGNAPLWSLSYEIWFYILGALAITVWRDAPHRTIAVIGLVFGLSVFTKLNPVFLFCWVMGALFYKTRTTTRSHAIAIPGLLLLVVGYVCSQAHSESVSFHTKAWVRYMPSPSVSILVFSAGVALMLVAFAKWKPSNGLLSKLEINGSRWAAFSYTLYLTHTPVLFLWDAAFPGRSVTIDITSISLYLARLGSCVFIAWVLYLPFERNTVHVRNCLRDAFGIKGHTT